MIKLLWTEIRYRGKAHVRRETRVWLNWLNWLKSGLGVSAAVSECWNFVEKLEELFTRGVSLVRSVRSVSSQRLIGGIFDLWETCFELSDGHLNVATLGTVFTTRRCGIIRPIA